MKTLLLFLTLLISAPISAQNPAKITRLTDHSLRAWSLMYREFSTEFLLCLYGTLDEVMMDTLVVQYSVLANVVPSESTADSVVSHENGACASDGLVGFAHSHPMGEGDEPGEPCFMSSRDYGAFVFGGFELAVTVCGEDRFYIIRRGQPANVCVFDAEVTPVPMDCYYVRNKGDQDGEG